MSHDAVARAGARIGSSPITLLFSLALLVLLLGLALAAASEWMRARGITWRKRLAVRGSEYELFHLGLGLALTTATLGFVALGLSIGDQGAIAAFDLALARAIRDAASPPLVWAMTAVSAVGSGWAVAFVAVSVAVALFIAHRRVLAIGWALAETGAGVLNYLLKLLFHRPRPFADAGPVPEGWSFPSGHTMGTLVTAGMVAYVVAHFVETTKTRIAVILAAAAWAVAVGFSRICLVAHYASDVVGGFAAGTLWLAICLSGIDVALRPGRRQRMLVPAP
jgi:membrane-associated phospholipid phosphatase